MSSEQNKTRPYYPKQEYAVLMTVIGVIGLLLIVFSALILILGLGGLSKLVIAQNVSLRNLRYDWLLIPIPILALVGIVLATFLTVYGLGYGRGTYLKVSPDGLEYKIWLTCRKRCSWQDLSRIETRVPPLGREFQVLHATRSDVRGLSGSLYSWKRGYFALLSELEGWPDGALANDLQKYAPQLGDEPRT